MLDYPPTPYADRYPRYFKPEVRFDSLCDALVFPNAWRSLPNLGYIESSWTHALAQCEATAASSREREMLSQVRSSLCRAFEHTTRTRPLPTLEDVAAELHVSPRTMIRRLRFLGTSYQEITREFLQARAREMLANDEITIKEISGMLGFDTPANFGRTFKRWFGISPGAYRDTFRNDGAAPAQRAAGESAAAPRRRTRKGARA
jgi:AraC-like DNA-binding protein